VESEKPLAALALGVQWWDWGEFRLELLGGCVEQRGVDEATEQNLKSDVGAVLGRLSVDLIDDPSCPTRGTWGRVEVFRSARSLGADPTYTRLDASLLMALSRGRNTTVFEGRFSTAFSSDLPVHHDFALGGTAAVGAAAAIALGQSLRLGPRHVSAKSGHAQHGAGGRGSACGVLAGGGQRLVRPWRYGTR